MDVIWAVEIGCSEGYSRSILYFYMEVGRRREDAVSRRRIYESVAANNRRISFPKLPYDIDNSITAYRTTCPTLTLPTW